MVWMKLRQVRFFCVLFGGVEREEMQEHESNAGPLLTKL